MTIPIPGTSPPTPKQTTLLNVRIGVLRGPQGVVLCSTHLHLPMQPHASCHKLVWRKARLWETGLLVSLPRYNGAEVLLLLLLLLLMMMMMTCALPMLTQLHRAKVMLLLALLCIGLSLPCLCLVLQAASQQHPRARLAAWPRSHRSKEQWCVEPCTATHTLSPSPSRNPFSRAALLLLLLLCCRVCRHVV